MSKRLENMFVLGEKVVLMPEGKKYDFGYLSARRGYAIIYEPGERNMQDSIVVPLNDLRKFRKK